MLVASTWGSVRRNQPDWFLESQELIKPLLEKRRQFYNQWIASGSSEDRARFRLARSKARAEIRRVKTVWLESVVAKADSGRGSCHGGSAWTAIRTIQSSFQLQDLRPVPVTTICKENGLPCTSVEAQTYILRTS